jgi:hypothetical protein
MRPSRAIKVGDRVAVSGAGNGIVDEIDMSKAPTYCTHSVRLDEPGFVENNAGKKVSTHRYLCRAQDLRKIS